MEMTTNIIVRLVIISVTVTLLCIKLNPRHGCAGGIYTVLDNVCVCPSILTLGGACAGGLRYLSCVCVCVSVCLCTPAPTSLVSTLKMRYVGGFSCFLIRGFSINPFVIYT